MQIPLHFKVTPVFVVPEVLGVDAKISLVWKLETGKHYLYNIPLLCKYITLFMFDSPRNLNVYNLLIEAIATK